MDGVDWKKAYHDLESHIEHIMEETSALVNNASPKLRINEIAYEEKEGVLEFIIDATGDRMNYAMYLIDRTGKHETIKLPYQKSNTFILDLPTGRYTFQGFAREEENINQPVSEKLNFNYKKVG